LVLPVEVETGSANMLASISYHTVLDAPPGSSHQSRRAAAVAADLLQAS
jgi:hypothetical protein